MSPEVRGAVDEVAKRGPPPLVVADDTRVLGELGEPHVNMLALDLALDRK